ncbi:MAG: hypothetical protein O9262_06985 [Cyclobacteriaceae bacterium]|nr:hypothetical protein [Cyclobacteriaceae bacterium]
MNTNKWIVATAFAFSLFSCKEKWQKALEKVDQRLLYGNDIQGWKLVQEINNEWEVNYTVEKMDNDTLKTIFFLEGVKDGSMIVNRYQKQYRCNDTDTCYLDMTSQDTLYFYRQNFNGEKIFEVGEYAYRFTYFKMDSAEVTYYLKHEDSLKRVRGSNLPRLSRTQ